MISKITLCQKQPETNKIRAMQVQVHATIHTQNCHQLPLLCTQRKVGKLFSTRSFHVARIYVWWSLHTRFDLLSKQWLCEWQFFRSAVFMFLLSAACVQAHHMYIYATWQCSVETEFTWNVTSLPLYLLPQCVWHTVTRNNKLHNSNSANCSKFND